MFTYTYCTFTKRHPMVNLQKKTFQEPYIPLMTGDLGSSGLLYVSKYVFPLTFHDPHHHGNNIVPFPYVQLNVSIK